MRKVPFSNINVHPCIEKLNYKSLISVQSILKDKRLIEDLKERPLDEHAVIDAIAKHYDVKVFIHIMRRQIEFGTLSRKEIFREMTRRYKKHRTKPNHRELSSLSEENKARFKSVEQMLGRQIVEIFKVFNSIRRPQNRSFRVLSYSDIFTAIADIINYCYATNLSANRIRSMYKNNVCSED